LGPVAAVVVGATVTAVAMPESWRGWYYAPFPLLHATLAVVIPLWYRSWPRGRPWPVIRACLPGQTVPIGVALAFAANFIVGYALLLNALGRASDFDWNLIVAYQQFWNLYVDRYGLAVVVVLSYALLGVWPMFGEELFYRGLLLRSLLNHTSPSMASLAVSTLFGLRHAAQLVYLLPVYPTMAAVAYFIWAFSLSMVLCWGYVRARSLWPCMALHSLNIVLAPLVLAILNG
jgi:membrane protease YdiL (CAAX protease family)